jgi:hypothetical protein
MDIYTVNLSLLLALCAALFLFQRRQKPPGPTPITTSDTGSITTSPNDTKTGSKPPKLTSTPKPKNSNRKSTTPFLLAYTLATSSDWLQGARTFNSPLLTNPNPRPPLPSPSPLQTASAEQPPRQTATLPPPTHHNHNQNQNQNQNQNHKTNETNTTRLTDLSPLYRDTHNVPPPLIPLLFMTGFLASAVSGAFLGRWADVYGRRRACLGFCVVYFFGGVFTSGVGFDVLEGVGLSFGGTKLGFGGLTMEMRMVGLVLGRVLGGVGTGLLFVAFESWVVGFLKGEDGDGDGGDGGGEELGRVFGVMSGLNSVAAVVCGVGSEWYVESGLSDALHFAPPFRCLWSRLAPQTGALPLGRSSLDTPWDHMADCS